MRNLGLREVKCPVQCPTVSRWRTYALDPGLALAACKPLKVGVTGIMYSVPALPQALDLHAFPMLHTTVLQGHAEKIGSLLQRRNERRGEERKVVKSIPRTHHESETWGV